MSSIVLSRGPFPVESNVISSPLIVRCSRACCADTDEEVALGLLLLLVVAPVVEEGAIAIYFMISSSNIMGREDVHLHELDDLLDEEAATGCFFSASCDTTSSFHFLTVPLAFCATWASENDLSLPTTFPMSVLY